MYDVLSTKPVLNKVFFKIFMCVCVCLILGKEFDPMFYLSLVLDQWELEFQVMFRLRLLFKMFLCDQNWNSWSVTKKLVTAAWYPVWSEYYFQYYLHGIWIEFSMLLVTSPSMRNWMLYAATPNTRQNEVWSYFQTAFCLSGLGFFLKCYSLFPFPYSSAKICKSLLIIQFANSPPLACFWSLWFFPFVPCLLLLNPKMSMPPCVLPISILMRTWLLREASPLPINPNISFYPHHLCLSSHFGYL